MKTFRMIGIALVAVLMCANFAACSDDDDDASKTEEAGIIGTWKGEFYYSEDDYQILTLTFSSDGKYTKIREGHEDGENYSETFKGTYSYNENTRKIDAKFINSDGETSTDDYYVKSVSTTTLVLIDWIDYEDGYTTYFDTFIRQ